MLIITSVTLFQVTSKKTQRVRVLYVLVWTPVNSPFVSLNRFSNKLRKQMRQEIADDIPSIGSRTEVFIGGTRVSSGKIILRGDFLGKLITRILSMNAIAVSAWPFVPSSPSVCLA